MLLSYNITLLSGKFMSSKHNVNIYLCDLKLPNCIKCRKKKRKNEKQIKFQFCPWFRHKLHFFPSLAPVSIQSSHWIFLLNFLQSSYKCRIHSFFSLCFKSLQQPVRGDRISVLISRNEYPLLQHLFNDIILSDIP